MERLFTRWFAYFRTRKWVLFSLAGIWVLACLYLVSGIRFEENIGNAFPNDPAVKKASDILAGSPFLEQIYIVVRNADPVSGTTEAIMASAETLYGKLEAGGNGYFADIRLQTDEEASAGLIDLVYHNIPYFLDSADYAALDSALAPERVRESIVNGYNTLLSPAGFALKQYFVKDPLGITWKGLKKLEKLNVSDNFTLQDGYIVTRNGQNLMMFARPVFRTGETGNNEKMLAVLQTAIRETLVENPGTEIVYYGAPIVSIANARQIRKDIFFTVGLAVVVLVVLISLYFRKWYAFPLLLVPVMFGALTAMAVLVLVKGTVSAITLGIGSIMLGIILDYSLHTYTHFRENGNAAHVIKEVAAVLSATSGTNVLAFSCLLFLSSALLNDLGLFAAVSIGSAAFFTLTVFPHMMGKPVKTATNESWLSAIASVPLDRFKLLFFGLVLAVIASLVLAPHISFNANLDKLGYTTPELREAENYLDQISGFKLKKIYIAAEGNHLEEALQQSQSYIPKLQQLEKDSVIDGFSSLNACWPSETVRTRQLEQWKSFWSPEKITRLQQHIREESTKLGIRQNAFDGFYAWLSQPQVYNTQEAMQVLSPLFFSDLIQQRDGKFTLLNIVRVKEENKPAVYSAFSGNDLIFDNTFIFTRLIATLQNDLMLLEWLSFFLVLGVVFVTFRRLELALATMIPMLSAWLITVGSMTVLGLSFNIFNIIICTFIFGLGIDYSIFLGRGILDQYRGKHGNLRAYKMSIILSLIITLLSIGVLIFAKHPALRSIAGIAALGMFVTGLVSFTVQPVMFRFFLYKKGEPRRLPITPVTLLTSLYALPLFIAISIFLLITGILLLQIFPNGRNRYEILVRNTCRFYLWAVFFIRKDFTEVDRSQFQKPAILIANRQSTIDLVLMASLTGKIRVVTKGWVFKIPILGSIARMLHFYHVDEAGQEDFIEKAKNDLANGYFIMFFPEGTRSKDFAIHRFKKGAFLLAEKTGADILPVLLHGTGMSMPVNAMMLGPGQFSMKTLPRITADNPDFAFPYQQKAKMICEQMRQEFYTFKTRVETPAFVRRGLIPRYIYRAPEVRKAYRELLRKKNSLTYLHELLGEKAPVFIDHAGYGELASYLLFRDASRKITIRENDPEKYTELCWLYHWHPELNTSVAFHTVIYYNSAPEQVSFLDNADITQVIFFPYTGAPVTREGWKTIYVHDILILEKDGNV